MTLNDVMSRLVNTRLSAHFGFIILALLGVGLVIISASTHLTDLAPLSDDLSMIAFSKTLSSDWFTKGLADYFIVFPEYYGPQSNFIRPVSNFVYWVFHSTIHDNAPFLANRIQVIVMNFGVLAASSALLSIIVFTISQSRILAALALICGLVMPPFWTTPATTYSSFVFDELSVLFCLVAFRAAENRRRFVIALCLTLAIMTKEITLPIIGGFFLYFILRRDFKSAVAPLIALMLWSALRLNAFGLHAEGLYVFEDTPFSLGEWLKEKTLNGLTLPLGPVFFDRIALPSGFEFINRDVTLLVINLVILLSIISILLAKASRTSIVAWLAGKQVAKSSAEHPALLATMISGLAFLFDAYIGANYRYALNLVPFLFIAIAGLPTHRQFRSLLLVIFGIGSVIASGPSLAKFVSGSEFETTRYRVIRELFETLRQHQNSKTLVVLNDFVSGYANPRALEILVPTPTRLLRGSSLYLDSCTPDEMNSITTHVTKNDEEWRVHASIPDCARFMFESAPRLAAFIKGDYLARNDRIDYRITPDQEWTGRHLTVQIRNADILYFDFKTGKWIFKTAAP